VGKDAQISAPDLPDGESRIFFSEDWTGQIALIRLNKIGRTRKASARSTGARCDEAIH
jgi:hypothetical protein